MKMLWDRYRKDHLKKYAAFLEQVELFEKFKKMANESKGLKIAIYAVAARISREEALVIRSQPIRPRGAKKGMVVKPNFKQTKP